MSMWEWRVFSRQPALTEAASRLGLSLPDEAPLDPTVMLKVKRRTDTYVDVGLQGVGLKIRNTSSPGFERLELKLRTSEIAGVEQWTKVLSAPFPVQAGSLNALRGAIMPEIADILWDYPQLQRLLAARGHAMLQIAKVSNRAKLLGVGVEVVALDAGPFGQAWSLSAEAEDLGRLLLSLRDAGLATEAEGALSLNPPHAELIGGYPCALPWLAPKAS